MIVDGAGDMFEADLDAVVNPVNTAGVMGKGLALAFKQRFPDASRAYVEACGAGRVHVGEMFVVERGGRPRWIVHFPTKQHWRKPSQLAFVRDGLVDLAAQIQARAIASIAVPALGCGAGGLAWSDVRPLIVAALDPLAARVVVYAPA